MSAKKIATYIIDILIFLSVGVCLALIYTYVPEKELHTPLIAIGALIVVILSAVELGALLRTRQSKLGRERNTPPDVASALVLLGEGQRAIREWDLLGHTSVLVGKESGEQQIDINLANTEYSSFVDDQHAMLNFTETGWYVEDLGSKNGTSLLRPGNDREQLLAPGVPCKILPGDVLCIASDTKLAVK